jgi:hypothetical protein
VKIRSNAAWAAGIATAWTAHFRPCHSGRTTSELAVSTQTRFTTRCSGTVLSMRLRNRRNSSARCRGVRSAMTFPDATSSAA